MAIFRASNWPTWEWNRFDEMERMRRDLEKLFQGFPGKLAKEPSAGVFPLANLTEDEHNYYVRAELPGMASDEIDISVTGDGLAIAGERKIPPEKKDAKYHRREREAGKFSRIISLPRPIDAAKVEASCTDGVLTVILPKAEAAKPRQISVKGA